MSRAFYLVQRMTAEDRPNRQGFDRHFALDYMGAAEFEWGALPKSLDRIRNSPRIITETVEVTAGGETATAYIVGGKAQAAEAAANMQEWIDGGCRGHEMAYFRERIAETQEEWMRRTNAWWDIKGDVMFTLDPTIAHRLLAAVSAA